MTPGSSHSRPGNPRGKMMAARIGAHMSIAGGYDKAVRRAHAFGFQSVQLFTKNTNQWRAAALTDAQRDTFRTAIAETGLADPVAHTSYLINLASHDQALWCKSIDAMTVEVERCAELGIPDLVAHPGAHVGQGEEAGLCRVAEALDRVHERTRGAGVTIDLETTAGQGTCLGHRFEHLARIIALVAENTRLGVCVDTCHIFAAGYSLATPEDYHETMEELDRAVGLDRVRVWHLNDSRRERGSRVDRHAGIGRGELGLEPFRYLLNDRRFRPIRMILETPKGTENGEELDAINLQTLRQLESRRSR